MLNVKGKKGSVILFSTIILENNKRKNGIKEAILVDLVEWVEAEWIWTFNYGFLIFLIILTTFNGGEG